MDHNQKNYECAYLLSPALPEKDVFDYVGKLTSLIEELKGAVTRAEHPKRRQLGYPVKKEKTAYFGWTIFSAPPESIKMLEKKLKSDETFLRYLIVEEETRKPLMPFRPLPQRPFPARPRAPTPRIEIKPEEKLDLEALDKKLEEILGK